MNRSVKSGDVDNYGEIPRAMNADVHGQKIVDILVKERKRRGQSMNGFTPPHPFYPPTLFLGGLHDAHPHWNGHGSSLVSPLTDSNVNHFKITFIERHRQK